MTAAHRANAIAAAGLVGLAGECALCDPRGVLYLPDLGLLCVSDLHLEKGSAIARRGALIPPYDTAATLARNPREVKARLCLGEFYRLNGFDDIGGREEAPKRDELGGTPTLFSGKPTPRGDIYADVIADPQAPAGEKAYALYRAINCYAPSGNNACGNADVAESQRRAWFQRLKRDYAASPWAKQLRYYW